MASPCFFFIFYEIVFYPALQVTYITQQVTQSFYKKSGSSCFVILLSMCLWENLSNVHASSIMAYTYIHTYVCIFCAILFFRLSNRRQLLLSFHLEIGTIKILEKCFERIPTFSFLLCYTSFAKITFIGYFYIGAFNPRWSLFLVILSLCHYNFLNVGFYSLSVLIFRQGRSFFFYVCTTCNVFFFWTLLQAFARMRRMKRNMACSENLLACFN